MKFNLWKLIVLILGLWLLNGCSTTKPPTAPIVGTVGFVCPPRPTLTPDTRPTETRVLHLDPPTPVPPSTAGPPPTALFTPAPTLTVPLDTEERVLAFLYAGEVQRGTQWKDPWCPEMLQSQPERVEAKRFNSVYEAESTMRSNSQSQEIEPAWVVTIRGTIDVNGPGGPFTAKYIRQVIGERTGNFYVSAVGSQDPPPPLGAPETAGPPKTRVRRTKTPRPTPTR